MLATPIATYHEDIETYFRVGLVWLLLPLVVFSLSDDTEDCFEFELEFEFWSSRLGGGCFRFLT